MAIGRGIVDAGWLGVLGLATLPDARGRGHARAVLGGLAAHGRAHGASRVFLQVASGNDRALRLYAGLGLRERSRYRYWSSPV